MVGVDGKRVAGGSVLEREERLRSGIRTCARSQERAFSFASFLRSASASASSTHPLSPAPSSSHPLLLHTQIRIQTPTLTALLGVLGGLTISLFSKPLALLLGLLVLGVQGLESQGIHLVPYNRLQRIFRNTDIKSALQDNVAMKVSFGLAFACAGFLSF